MKWIYQFIATICLYFWLTLNFSNAQSTQEITKYSPSRDYKTIVSLAKQDKIKSDQLSGSKASLLRIALSKGEKSDIGILKGENLIDIHTKDDEGRTVLRQKVETGNYAHVEKLISYDTETNKTKLATFAINNHDDKMLEIVAPYAKANTVFLHAAKKDDEESFRILINKGLKTSSTEVLTTAIDKLNEDIARLCMAKLKIDPKAGFIHALEGGDKGMIALCMDYAEANYCAKYLVDNRMNEYLRLSFDHGADKNELLNYAYGRGNMDATYLCLREGANANTIIKHAVSANREDLVSDLLRQFNANPNYTLEAASQYSNLNIAKLALQHDANPNIGMNYAIDNQHYELLQMLLSEGANARQPDYIGKVARLGNLDMVKLLVEYNASPEDAMYNAVAYGHIYIVQYCVDKGVSTTPSNYISTSAAGGFLSITKILVENGANPQYGVMESIEHQHPTTLSYLITQDASVENPAYIQMASQVGSNVLVQIILDQGVDPNLGIETSIIYNHPDVVSLLITSGADPSPKAYISKAVNKNFVQVAAILLKEGADATPPEFMHTAVSNNYLEMAKVLIQYKADATPTALIGLAVNKEFIQMVEVLIKAGADPSPGAYLGYAVDKLNLQLSEILLRYGSDFNYKYNSGESLLHRSVKKRSIAITTLLCKKGISGNVKDARGNTPLHIAASYRGNDKKSTIEYCKVLVNIAGANVNIKNRGGKTPLKLARGISSERSFMGKQKRAAKKMSR